MAEFTTTPGGAYLQTPSVDRNRLAVSGSFDPREEFTELTMPDGRIVRVPTHHLISLENAEDASFEEEDDDGTTVIPLIEERLEVGKRTVVTGTVRLHKRVQEHHETIDEPLAVRTFDVERVLLNQPVETAPEVRQEGAKTIYPVVEEQMVLTKRLILKEEVWVTRRDTERRDNQVVTLRREHLAIEREPGAKG